MARGRPKTFDPEAALDDVTSLLWREGVRVLSLNDIARRTGHAKPNLASAFGGKDALVARAIDRYYDGTGQRLEASLRGGGAPAEIARRYLTAVVDGFVDEGTPPSCLLATATTECAGVSDGPLRETIDRLNAQGTDALRAALAAAGAEEPDELTRFVVGQTVALSGLARAGEERASLISFVERAVGGCEIDLKTCATSV